MDADIGIIGIGTVGSMALWHLAQRGASVIGFEQFGIGHDRSAAGGETRIFRTAYKEDSSYVPILQEAYRQWRKLENNSGTELLTITKGLTIGNPDSTSMKNLLKSIKEYDLEYEIFDAKKAKDHYPQHYLSKDQIMVVDYKAGYLRPQLAVVSAVERALELGATVYNHTCVEKIESNKDRVKIIANGQEYTVGKVLVTAGPWSREIIPELIDELEVRRLINGWFFAKNIDSFNENNFPVFTRENPTDNYYGIPAVDSDMVKIGLGSTPNERIHNADSLDKNIKIDDISKLVNVVRRDIPNLLEDPVRINAYMEVYTKDKHAIVGTVPSYHGHVIALTGFSGHGFKMAPVMGEIGAMLALGEEVPFSINGLSPDRFSENS